MGSRGGEEVTYTYELAIFGTTPPPCLYYLMIKLKYIITYIYIYVYVAQSCFYDIGITTALLSHY